MLWIAAAIVCWWLGALAAGVRYDLVRLEEGDEPGEGYDLVSLLRRLRDDPVALGLRLRFSRYLAAAFVPLSLAAAVADLRWEWTLAAFAVGWLSAAAIEATGGGRTTRRIGRLRGGMLYGVWARMTLLPVRLTGPLLRLRTDSIEEDDEHTLVLAESEAALAASRGRLGREERRLLRGLLASGSIRVADIMTPWERVRWLDAERFLADNIPSGDRARRLDAGRFLDEAAGTVLDSGHSRLPVLRDGKVVGLLTAKDLLRRDEDAEGGLREILRPAYFVTGELNGRDLLEELQAARVHLAVVVDRLGRLAGIVTMEDLLEEIVGELHDEREREPQR